MSEIEKQVVRRRVIVPLTLHPAKLTWSQIKEQHPEILIDALGMIQSGTLKKDFLRDAVSPDVLERLLAIDWSKAGSLALKPKGPTLLRRVIESKVVHGNLWNRLVEQVVATSSQGSESVVTTRPRIVNFGVVFRGSASYQHVDISTNISEEFLIRLVNDSGDDFSAVLEAPPVTRPSDPYPVYANTSVGSDGVSCLVEAGHPQPVGLQFAPGPSAALGEHTARLEIRRKSTGALFETFTLIGKLEDIALSASLADTSAQVLISQDASLTVGFTYVGHGPSGADIEFRFLSATGEKGTDDAQHAKIRCGAKVSTINGDGTRQSIELAFHADADCDFGGYLCKVLYSGYNVSGIIEVYVEVLETTMVYVVAPVSALDVTMRLGTIVLGRSGVMTLTGAFTSSASSWTEHCQISVWVNQGQTGETVTFDMKPGARLSLRGVIHSSWLRDNWYQAIASGLQCALSAHIGAWEALKEDLSSLGGDFNVSVSGGDDDTEQPGGPNHLENP